MLLLFVVVLSSDVRTCRGEQINDSGLRSVSSSQYLVLMSESWVRLSYLGFLSLPAAGAGALSVYQQVTVDVLADSQNTLPDLSEPDRIKRFMSL